MPRTAALRGFSALALALCACGGGGADGMGDVLEDAADNADTTGPFDAALFGASPRRISARGGVELTISGRGFAEPLTVTLDGVPAEVLDVQPEVVTVRSPRLVAGATDLAVTVAGVSLPPLLGAITVDPLSLSWVTASPDTMAAFGDGPVRAVVAYDFDADGDLDLVAGTDDGLRVLQNDGFGRLARFERVDPDTGAVSAVVPGGRAQILALAVADLDSDGADELIVGTGAGRDLVLRGALTGLEPAGVAPLRDGITEALAVGDFDGDGTTDIALLLRQTAGSSDRGLVILQGDGRGGFSVNAASAPPGDEEHAVGSATSTDTNAALTFMRRPIEDGDGGETRLAWTLHSPGETAVFTMPTRLAEVPASFSMRLRRDGGDATVRPRVVDSTGAAFVGEALTIGMSYVAIRTTPVASWTRVSDGEGGPTPPLSEFSLLVEPGRDEPPLEGALLLDEVSAEPTSGLMVSAIATFDERAPRLVWADARTLLSGPLDGDDAADLVVLRQGAPILLATWGSEPGLFTPALVGTSTSGPFTAGTLLDADSDGALDITLVSATQDRLVVGDGWGRFVDATLGAMPVDSVDGASVVAADFDLDGAVDLVIGNRGGSDRLYMGRGDGRFSDMTPSFGFDQVDAFAIIAADLDGDGADDVVTVPVDPAAPVVVRFAVEDTR